MTAASQPLVSVGVPVRNGDATLERALESVVGQTYANLEIIISDNGSTDGTRSIGETFAARDPRIRYVRHDSAMTALANFRYVFDQSRGNFFMWAAHDDVRSQNYVETLLRGFARHREAALCFSEAREFSEHPAWQDAPVVDHDFDTVGLSFAERVRKQTTHGCMHVYGLLNSALLRDYPWYDIEDGPDVVLLLWLGTRGPLVYEPGATFYYHRVPGRDREARARDTSYRRLKPFHKERLAWLCATAVEHAAARSGRGLSRFRTLPLVYFHIVQGPRGLVYEWLPGWLRAAWQRHKARARRDDCEIAR